MYPAKYWKSFGTLTITLDKTDNDYELTTNIGSPIKCEINKISTWEFDTIPAEILEIIYKPKVNSKAETLIKIRPDRLTYIFGIFLIILHILMVFQYRIKRLQKRFSWIVIIGSLIFPLVFLLSRPLFYTLIDNMIGEHASRLHGYVGLELLFYPMLMPLYWVIMWQIDKYLKRKRTKTHYNTQ